LSEHHCRPYLSHELHLSQVVVQYGLIRHTLALHSLAIQLTQTLNKNGMVLQSTAAAAAAVAVAATWS
jgi:hypothetical protein